MTRIATLLLIALVLVPGEARAMTNQQLEVFDQEAYETKVEPALASWLHGQTVEPLRGLLRETIRRLEASPHPERNESFAGTPLAALPRARHLLQVVEEDALVQVKDHAAGEARRARLQPFVEEDLAPLLIDVWCTPRQDGRPLELNLWDSPLAAHLHARSSWIKAAFDGTSPPSYGQTRFSRAPATAYLAPWWVARFDAELRKVERPRDARAARDLDRLRKMLELVRTQPALRLVLTD